MSGIAGIVHADGGPVDRAVLAAMTDALRFRGPDACRVWTANGVGFGHTLFATTDDAVGESQPCTLDGAVWIVADARIDGRADLVRALAAHGRTRLDQAHDAELILHAYTVWGVQCAEHLLGDFVFAVWDAPARLLFCARDHFGVRPFFYASRPGVLLFSNTLDAVRQHPAVSDRLNDLAIADFLLFKSNQEPDTTAFADVRRLPPAHTLTWAAGASAPVLGRYWRLALGQQLRYQTAGDYLARYREVFGAAVGDRLRTRRVAVSMSGGLDSPMVAAVARDLLAADGRPFDLRAHTIVYDSLIPDDERTYAGRVAEALRIPIQFFAVDGYAPFADGAPGDRPLPEPASAAFRTMGLAFDRQMVAHARVAFAGTDADALLSELTSDHMGALAREGRFAELLAVVGRYAWWLRSYPPVRLRERVDRWRRRHEPGPQLPPWLNPDLVTRLDLAARWRDVHARRARRPTTRPRAVVSAGWWHHIFEAGDAGTTGIPLEYRYPFADVRVVDYLLAIPAVPWCTDKTLLRMALDGVLPESVRRRKKTPLARDPVVAALGRDTIGGLDAFRPAPGFGEYVVRALVPRVTGAAADDAVYDHLRPLALNQWLRKCRTDGAGHVESRTGALDAKRHEHQSAR
jgi:asparagine synthase (glutamine-hydrolysing)